MNNLEKLFSVLSADERELAASAATTGFEQREIAALNSPASAKGSTENKKGNKAYNDNLRSILYRKILLTLVPEGGLKLLSFLRNTDNLTIFRNELRLQEKEIEEASQAERELFYREVCDLLRQRTINDFDEKLMRIYLEKYYHVRAKRHPAERWLIEAFILSKKLWAMQQSNFDKSMEPYMREYKTIYAAFAQRSDNESVYARIGLRISAEKLTNTLSDDTITEIDESIALMRTQGGDPYEIFTLEHHRILILMILVRCDEALMHIKEFEKKFLEHDPAGDSLYVMWAINAIIISDIPMMEYAVGVLEEKHRGDIHPSRKVQMLLCKTYCALVRRQAEEFTEYMDELKQLNQGEFHAISTEIVMRRLETACHFCKGDTEFVLSLIEKNVKFHKYHKTNTRKPQLMEFYSIAKALAVAKQTNTPLKPSTIKKLDAMRKKEGLIWRTLVEMQKSL